MRYSKEHKEETRERIVEAAGRVFKRRGYQGGGVDAVMKAAGLTHGGFYAHFPSKEALFAEVLTKASQKIRKTRNSRTHGLAGAAWVRAMMELYLSPLHQQHVESGCPVPPLVSELPRAGEKPKQNFEKELRTWQEEVRENLHHLPAEQRDSAALGVLAACVGSMVLARAVAEEELSEDFLRAGRHMVERAFLEGHHDEHSDEYTPGETNETDQEIDS